MNWTPERVQTLKKLWSEGLSASQIADQLGGVSRNAVIGKVNRLKLSSRGRSAPVISRQKKKKPTMANSAAPKMPRKRVGHAAPPEEPKTEPAPKPITLAAPMLVVATVLDEQNEPSESVIRLAGATPDAQGVGVPVSRRLKLTELSDRVCRWPNGDPLQDDFHFCGNTPKDGVCYCAYHARMAYQSVSERRRAR